MIDFSSQWTMKELHDGKTTVPKFSVSSVRMRCCLSAVQSAQQFNAGRVIFFPRKAQILRKRSGGIGAIQWYGGSLFREVS